MDWMIVLVLAGGLLLGLVILNSYVILRLVRSDAFTRKQKIIQAILIWVLPLFGAALVLHFLNESDSGSGPDEPPFGDGPGNVHSVIMGDGQ
jgi:hypothetical protein